MDLLVLKGLGNKMSLAGALFDIYVMPNQTTVLLKLLWSLISVY